MTLTSNEPLFSTILRQAKRVSRDEFALNFGGIDHDVVEMLEGEAAKAAIQEVRQKMEREAILPNGQPRLRQHVTFGNFEDAPELEQGLVAAVDGTFALPLQLYSAGQALCIGVGSLSHRRSVLESLTYWSSRVFLDEAANAHEFIGRSEEVVFKVSQTALMRYCEVQHGLEIDEPVIFFDGTLIYEWLLTTPEGLSCYRNLFESGKKCIGVMKSLKNNVSFGMFARALRTGETYIIETLAEHLAASQVTNKNHGEARTSYVSAEFTRQYASHILRGVFKPGQKVFAFEVHENHLEDMLRIMAADCQINNVGHEIPYLLNRVDEAVQHAFKQSILRERIANQMSRQSEELFFEETDEREFR
jgi:hypothetical protein